MKIDALILLSALLPAATGPAPGRLPIQNDDYAHARAEATRRHVPIFVDCWAPW